jgi:DNA polymerase elongation subunit (family B)
LAIRFIARELASFLDNKLGIERGFDRWIYGDTDSIYFTLDDFVDKLTNGNESAYPKQKIVDAVDMFCKKQIEPYIKAGYERLAEYMNAYDNFMSMKREVIADRALFRAKKNYVMQVYDNEGVRYEEPKIKMMGVETARSTTPQFVKDALVESYKIMMNGQNKELLDMIAAFKLEYMNQDVDMISTPRGVSDLDKWVDGSGEYKLRIIQSLSLCTG